MHQQKSGRRPRFSSLSKMLTEARAHNAWLRQGSQCAQQQMVGNYSRALSQSGTVRGRGRPTLKAHKKARPSMEFTTRGFTLRGGRLNLPGKVSIPVVWSRALPTAPTSVRVFEDSLGHWYAAFVTRREAPSHPAAIDGIGIDWGVTVTATTTDPAFDLPHLGYRRRCAAELAKAQKKMARRARPRGHAQSNGYRRARLHAAILQKKAARQTAHAASTWAKRVVDAHAVIAVEDFKPTFLAKTTMARKAADAAIGATKRILIGRGVRAGRKVVLVPPAYTTMTCSGCFARAKQRLGLGVRSFVCVTCGYTAGRDENAARVILATAESDRAGADDVRHVITSFRGSEITCGLSQESPGFTSGGGVNGYPRRRSVSRASDT